MGIGMPAPLFLLAPGAGAPASSGWMSAFRARLARSGQVAVFDYPYQVERRRRPDRNDVLLAAHRHALQQARQGHSGPLVLVGKITTYKVCDRGVIYQAH
jgi:hypothetical protein